jgi:peptidoglycan/xylan/chitin deacetylase (PgdA/CDA1 family)
MFASGHGWVKRTGDTGTVADDTTVFTEGSQSISLLTSGTASASTTAVSPVLAPTLDLTQNSLVFKIRVDQWANLGTLFFLASNDASAALSTTRAIVSVAFAGSLLAADGEFAWIGVNPGDWATAGGFSAVTMSAVSRIAVQAQQGSGSAVQVNLQQVWTRPAPTTPATIITFDDGYGSQYTNAKPYMDKYGFRGVLFPIRDLISGSGTYVTIPQLQAFYDSGWDIVAHADLAASHNSTNALIDLSISDGSATALSTFEGELVRNKKWLIANGWTRSADFFGWPQGKFDAARLAIARKYFSLIRLYRPNLNAAEADTYPFVDGGRLKQLAVQGGGSPSSASSVTAALTAAWAAKKTVVLTFHGINSTSPQSYDYPVASFQTIIDFIAASGYPVKTLSAVMRDNGVDAPVGTADVAAKLTIPTGTPDGTKFARDDGTYAVPPGTGGLPTQTGNSGKVLTTNGTAASWGTVVSNPGVPTPTQNAMLGWTSDPLAGLNGNSAIPLTFVQVARIIADASGTVGNLLLHLGVLGTGQTSCEFQVFDSTGTLLGTTGDVKATMAGAVGGKKIPITVPFAVVAGATYYVAATSIGGTSPQLGRQGLTASPQVLTSDIIPIQRFGVVSGAVGSAPASITPGSLVTGGTAFWYGLKT